MLKLAAFFAALSVAAPAGAAIPPIVFASNASPELFTPHRYEIATTGGPPVEEPVAAADLPSPNGSLVARFAGPQNAPTVEVASAGGGPPRTIVQAFPEPAGVGAFRFALAWSPNGKRLAVTLLLTGNTYELWTVGADGSALTRIGRGRGASWAPDSDRLAYTAYYGPYSHDTVFVARADGRNARPLGIGVRPIWAPRGNAIAYAGQHGLAIVDAATRRKRAVGGAPYAPSASWSPDATRLAFVASPHPALEVFDLRTGRTRTIAGGGKKPAELSLPAWSPDGRRLAYVGSTRTYVEPAAVPARTFPVANQVLIVSALGGHVQQVTTEPPWASFSELRWAPDGTHLEYVVELTANDYDLYGVQPDGSGLTRLTNDLPDERAPAWSPDGTQLAFVRTSLLGFPTVDAGIFVGDLATGAERRMNIPLLPRTADADPAWSPDGTTIAAVVGTELEFARSDTGDLVRTFASHGAPGHPTWAPDGSRLAFSDGAFGSQRAIFVIDSDGNGLRQLTSMEYAIAPAWSPDGQWIAFFGSDVSMGLGVWVVRPDGSDLTKVAAIQLATSSGAPAWSPDSTHLLYATVVYGAPELGALHEVARDGSDDHVLTTTAGEITEPSWRATP